MCNATRISNKQYILRNDGLTRHVRSLFAALRFNPLILVLSMAAIIPSHAGADASPYPTMAPVAQYMMDRDAEIAFARTAAPKSISDDATVMTLGKAGYETAVKGSNGFVCLVVRSWDNDFDVPDYWDPRDRTPQCWNAAAANSFLPEYLKRTEWVLAGVSNDEVQARTKQGWASHEFQLPAPGSVAYMMSKDQCIHAPAPCNWYPHVMFFVPTADAWKGGDNLPGVPVFSAASDVEPVTTFFVVVPKWSDGSFGPYIPTPATTTATPGHHHG